MSQTVLMTNITIQMQPIGLLFLLLGVVPMLMVLEELVIKRRKSQ